MISHLGQLADNSEAIRLDPNNSDAYRNRGFSRQTKGEYDNAIADYSESIRLDSKSSNICNTLAWLYATRPDEKYRDGKKAVELAMKACELTTRK